MSEPLDVFVVIAKDKYEWIGYARSYDEAIALIRKVRRPGTFFVHSQITGRRTFFQAAPDSSIVQLPGPPPE